MADQNSELPLGRKVRDGNETSIWKKEISFGAAQQGDPEPLVVASPEPVVVPEPEPVVVVEPEPVVVAEPEPEPVLVAEPAVVAEPEPVVAEPVVPELVVSEPVAVPEIEPVVGAAVEQAAEIVLPVEPAAVVETPAPPPLEPATALDLPTIELEPAEAEPPRPAPAPAAVEPAVPLPEPSGEYGWLTDGLDEEHALPAAASPPALPDPVQPDPVQPVAAAAEPGLPALDLEGPDLEGPDPGGADKVPFWKKDVSLSRKPKSERGNKAPKERKSGREKTPKEPKEQSRPFWKRDLSFSRTPKDVTEAAGTAKAERVPTERSAPFWKRDLSFSKKKGAQAAKGAKGKFKAQPFWKKDLSFGRSADAAKTAPVDRTRKPAKKGKKDVVIGLKIGASQLAAARVVNNGSPELVQVAREPLEDGIIVGGELRDPETLTAELSAFFARHKLPKRNVRLGIANNRIGVRTFEIGGIDDPRQLANAIRFRAQETLPIPLEEAVLDWQVLSETHDDEGGTSRRVLLVVAYRELVDRYVAACKKAGIRLSGIDLEAFAMLRAVIPPPPPGAPDPDGASVVVNVGHDRSTLAVSDGHICEFTRVLSWGGQSLSVAIARALDQTPSEVEPLKHALVLGGTITAPDGFSQEQTDAGNESVSRELQAFARELVSSLRFYQNQPGSLGIGQIVLTGGTSHMPGLAAELERLIGVTVRVGDPLSRVKVSKRFKDPDQLGSFAVAVGLGIDD